MDFASVCLHVRLFARLADCVAYPLFVCLFMRPCLHLSPALFLLSHVWLAGLWLQGIA